MGLLIPHLRSQAEPYLAVRWPMHWAASIVASRSGCREEPLGSGGITYRAAYLSHYRDPRAGRSAVRGQATIASATARCNGSAWRRTPGRRPPSPVEHAMLSAPDLARV